MKYEIKRSKRKTIAIEVTEDNQVIVRAPVGISTEYINNLVQKKSDWINAKLKVRENREQPKEDVVYYLGQAYHIKEVVGKEEGIQLIDQEIVVTKSITNTTSTKELILNWLLLEAKREIFRSVEQYSKILNVTYNRITIKDQKTRWGSCSSKGNLNFNFRLIMCPKKVLDYVVVHELAHRIEMNHSSSFWSIVSEVMPDYKLQKEWLRQNGYKLNLSI